MARAMGADIVIAVNVGTPLAPENELGSSLGVAQQMLRILTEQNVQRSLQDLRPDDILISPDLAGVSFMDFRAHERAIQVGVDAARHMAAPLQALSLPPERYAAYERARLSRAAQASVALPLPLARIEVQGPDHINPAALLVQSGLKPGDAVTEEQVREAAARLYGRGDVERVSAEVVDADGERNVTLHVTEADWARSRLRLGLELTSDFSDSSTYSVVGMHVATSLNAWGAEMRTIGRIGSRRSLSSEWWQPLGAGSPWYVAPFVGIGAGATDVFEGGRRVVRAGFTGEQVGVALGRQLSDWGDVRAGIGRVAQHESQLIPEDPSSASYSVGNVRFLQLRVDTLEPIAFPVQGQLLLAEWVQATTHDVPARKSAQAQLTALAAFSSGDWAGHVYGEWARAQDGPAPLRLGGFLRLSGTDPLSIGGSSVVLGRVVLARRIGYLPATLGGALRAGFSLEAGAGFGPDEPVQFGAMKQAGSGFLALDTRFGPLYLGAGATRGSGGTLYLFLGPIW
jgi:NTE family protein